MTESRPEMTASTPLLRIAARMLGVGALGLVLLLVIGAALPGTWAIERSTVMQAPAARVFDLLTHLDRWEEWTPWPSMELVRSGPAFGVGAQMSWDDPFAGDGVFRIVTSEPNSLLSYRVSVQGGAITTNGALRLEERDGVTHVQWRETGDFGWNPLMGYAALTMNRTQGTELERGLARLKSVAETGALPPDPG